MKQAYHSNARTNLHIRAEINNSNLTNNEISQKYNISETTVSKWKNRDDFEDKSSKPNTISYALNSIEQQLIVSVRKASWLPVDEIFEMLLEKNNQISRSSVYRTLCRNNINRVPEEQKEKAKKFKEYDPGYLHIDVTYLPKFGKIKYYLFVAIDRATRAMYFKVYDAKTSKNAESFMKECLDFFPFGITHVLTDNGLEFTNKLIKSKKGNYCTKPSKLDDICSENEIEHRLTKPGTPKTNGMVERVNATIKNDTVKRNGYENKEQMNVDLMRFLTHYILHRRHGSLRKELNVKTPFQAIEKWFRINPEIFKETPEKFKQKIVSLNSNL